MNLYNSLSLTLTKKYILKILTAGEGGVGKTTLLKRYVEGNFTSGTKLTVGIEFFVKEFTLAENHCALQLWDFGGQDRFRFLADSYVMGAKGALLMFDLTRISTLETVSEWVSLLRSCNENLPIVLVGTKLDLEEDITIDDNYALSIKEEYNFFDYIKISSKTGVGVEDTFIRLVKKIIYKE
ncbi:MAG: GTP-binding protein [Promethearchaeota archaeon]|nr:MAG: GTP-binding protein [Candidatus Lokiarchaeota archaeon]